MAESPFIKTVAVSRAPIVRRQTKTEYQREVRLKKHPKHQKAKK
jgi:hypothetical protein